MFKSIKSNLKLRILVCTNVNNYVIFVPHVPIYWSERINKVKVKEHSRY